MQISIMNKTGDTKFFPQDNAEYEKIMREEVIPTMKSNRMILCMQHKQGQVQEQVYVNNNKSFEQAVEKARDAELIILRPSITAG